MTTLLQPELQEPPVFRKQKKPKSHNITFREYVVFMSLVDFILSSTTPSRVVVLSEL